MWSVLLVDMENMYPEPISLFERPVAKVTWKFPIPLVDASRVLQVLISVVFVGEDLPTPVTFKSLSRILKWEKKKKDH